MILTCTTAQTNGFDRNGYRSVGGRRVTSSFVNYLKRSSRVSSIKSWPCQVIADFLPAILRFLHFDFQRQGSVINLKVACSNRS